MRRQEHRRSGRRPALVLSLAIAAALALTAAATLRHDAPPAAAIGENSLTFPDPHPSDNVGFDTSMKLDANGFPVVAYAKTGAGENANQIRLLHCNDVDCAGGDESVETVFSSGFGVATPSLSLDSAGNPIIIFLHFGINVIHCNDVNCDGSNESFVTHVPNCCLLYSSHVLAPGDLPVVVFRGNGLQILRCANTNCTSVSNDPNFILQVEPTAANSIALDASGFPVVAYSGADGLRLLHCNDANCAGGDESVQFLDGSMSGRHTALSLVNGNPVIAYTGTSSGLSQIKVARCDDPNCAPGGDTFQFLTSEIVSSNSAPGLAIDAAGNPVISFYREHNQTRVIHCNDPACAGEDESHVLAAAAGGSGAVNGATSIALDASGRPVVSLYAASGNDLAVLHCGDVNCSIPPLPTPTNTPVPPPATSTSAPTNTPVPPTATHTPTSTPVGSNGRIVFATDRDSQLQFDLYVMDTDGADPTCLTNTADPVQSFRPDWSPDGTKVVFTRSRGGNNDRELFVVDADGSNLVNLTNNAVLDEEAAWSPDGTKIAFSSQRDGNDDIFVMDADGSNVVNLTNGADGDFIDEFPAWSPDGTKIAFTAYRDVFTLQAEIYVMNADGSNQTRLSNNVFMDNHANWSPDGTKIAFSSTRDGNTEIYVMDAADGGNQTRLTNSALDDFVPKFSPDGTQTAFVTNRTGNYEIFVMDADGSNQVNITNSPGTDTQPSWTGNTPIDPNCPAPEPTATPTITNTPTNTTVPPTATNTPIPPTSTNTPVPPTATHTPTNTPVPPTATHTATNTPIPPTATHTATNTPVPPTATHTATNTPVPPTATHTATNTPIPPTATQTATNTPVPPTATNTPMPATATHTATNTPIPPTSTSTPAPPTATATPLTDRCADINGDGRVNSGDLVRVFIAMFRPYEARFDINRDGEVNLADLFAAARQYGPRRC